MLTADCVPILMIAPRLKLVAAIHAGWRGTLEGIAARAAHLFNERGVSAAEIEVALGPSIGGCCYEIKEDVLGPLIDNWGELAKGDLNRRGAKCFLELRRLNRNILEQAGIPAKQIFEVGPCTSCASEEFFSYRRERKETGRQISFVGWHS